MGGHYIALVGLLVSLGPDLMESPIFKPPGTHVSELDTPALVVDLTELDQNIERLHSFFRGVDAKVRPHVGIHRCPAIARKQLAAGGTVGGIAVNTVGEAETFAHSGFEDIFITGAVALPLKIARVCSLARLCRMTVAVDNPAVVRDLSDSAQSAGVVLRVVVDIHTRLDRGGVEPGPDAVDFARRVSSAPGLHFAGLMTYEGPVSAGDSEDPVSRSRRCIQSVLDTREMIESQGMEVEVVSVGGTHNYDIAGAMSGVTEVPAGAYAIMDLRYGEYRPEFRPAARVMCTVTSHPEPGKAMTDAGEKAVGSNNGPPEVDGVPGASATSLDAEHGRLDLEGQAQESVDLGGKLWFVPGDASTCFNLHDYVNAVRDGRLEAVWPISARGRYR